MAVATSAVFTTKYVSVVAASGTSVGPPVAAESVPDESGRLDRNGDRRNAERRAIKRPRAADPERALEQNPADDVSIAMLGPRIINARRSAAHAMDMVDTPRHSGSRSLKFESRSEAPSRATVRGRFEKLRGVKPMSRETPTAVTPPM